jgi:hypothetical protein
VNRQERRAARARGPRGEELVPVLLRVDERDARGRPTRVCVCYEDSTMAEASAGQPSAVFVVAWTHPASLRSS